MITKKLKLNLEHGLHARPSAYIVQNIGPLNLDIATITYKNQTADMKSILSLLTLFTENGSEVTIKISGTDENKALSILEDILSGKKTTEIYKK